MVQLLLFSVDEIHGAIPLADTSHVIRMVGLAKKTGSLPAEAGTINFHGKLIPVFSVRQLFGLPGTSPRLTDMLIVAHAGAGDVALWVDSTSGIQDMPLTLEFPDLPEQSPTGIPGICVTPDNVWIITDLSRMIAPGTDAPALSDSPLIPLRMTKGTIPREDEHYGEDESAAITRITALLEERAKKIARPEEGRSDAAIVEVLKFRLAYQEYAIEMQYIREVILTGEITPVPGTPAYISGICVVRGEIISLVDLRGLLSIPERGLTDLNRVIVLTDHTLTFGILADHITGIGVIEMDLISNTEERIPVKNEYIRGMAAGSLIVLDTAAIFADPKMIIEDI